MRLDGAMTNAAGGLANINRQMALLSQNVANANTPDYAVEVSTQESVTADGLGLGVRTGLPRRQIDIALQAASFRQDGVVAGLQVRQQALQAIDSVQGTPGQGNDLPSLVGALGDTFTALLNGPANQAAQSQVVSAAGSLVRGINAMSEAYGAQRQAAQTDLGPSLATLNDTLKQIGALSEKIVLERVTGRGTADLENQRAAAVHGLSRLLDVRTMEQPSGDMLVSTPSGLALTIRGRDTVFAMTGANLDPTTTYANGGVPAITVGGVDVTRQLQGGRIGANITLRDTTIPTFQAELDEFSFSLATRFSAQGLTLFTDASGTVPAGGGSPTQAGYVGLASTIQVNPAVRAQPGLVRDGTDAVAGSASGASAFTPNPPGGPASFAALINRVVTYALGDQAQSGVAQPSINTTGLGPDGTLSAPYVPPASLAGIATTLVAAQAQETAVAANQLDTETGVQTGLADRLAANSGVSMDTEMSKMISLQTAYGANARVMSTVQALLTELLNAVRS